MKNSKIRVLSALLAVMLCIAAFPLTAYAGGGPEYEEPIPEQAEETTGGYEPEPLTPDGNMTLVDDISGEPSGDKQFIVVVTRNGNYFYIIIDRAEDGENTVHFLNQVDEADLLALLEEESTSAPTPPATCVCTDKCVAGEVNTNCPVCKTDMTNCMGKEAAAPEPEPEPKKSGGMGGVLVIVLILALGGGGAYYYFKVMNRSLRDDSGQIYDIVAGPFVVTGLGEENFASLSPEFAEKYMEHFRTPEMFAMINGELTAIPLPTVTPDVFLTGEKIKTPRGNFSLTEMTREQIEAAGYGYHHSSEDNLYHIMGNSTRAFAIVNENARTYDIYQLKDTPGRRDYAFEALDRLHEQGCRVDMQNYDKVYSGSMRPNENLESIYTRFNVDRPKDFTGHSLSMSDVVVIHQDGKGTAHYCDRFGFAEVPEFFEPGNYLKNAEMAMEDDFGMIDGVINNGVKEVTPPGSDEKASIKDRLAEAKRECAERKPTEKKPERSGPEHDL